MRAIKINQKITNRNTSSIERYLQDVAKINNSKILTAEEEVELGNRIKQGDKAAADKLVECNLRFVVSVAKQYYADGIELDDIISEGNIGLMKAVYKYDPSRGYKFISYAVWWIRQSIHCFLCENPDNVRLPLNKINQLNKIKKVKTRLEQKLERKPSTNEILDELDFKLNDAGLDILMSASKKKTSLNTPVVSSKGTEEDVCLIDLLGNPEDDATNEIMNNEDLKTVIKITLDKLPERHRATLEMLYGLNGKKPLSMEEIAYKMGLTRERIRQIHINAIRKLRSHTYKQNFISYL